MMNQNEFKTEFIDGCLDEMRLLSPIPTRIEEHIVNKPQFGALTGLCFNRPGTACAPTIYVEDFYELYTEGYRVTQLSKDAARTILNSFEQIGSIPTANFDIREQPEMLRVRLIGKKGNEELLESTPHMDPAEGISLIVYMETYEYRALVSGSLLEGSGMTEDELFSSAFESSLIYDPPSMIDLAAAISEDPSDRINYLSSRPYMPVKPEDYAGRLFVLSNAALYWGSSSFFYPGVTDKIHAVLGNAFYMIPSSVHELLLTSAAGADPDSLAQVLRSANREIVDIHDRLSDDIYICRSGKLSKVRTCVEDLPACPGRCS